MQAILQTDRLILRPITLRDAPSVQQLANSREIADTTVSIPHPCSLPQTRRWITEQGRARAKGSGIVFVVELAESRQLIGTIGLRDISKEHARAELGFWIGVNWWGKGYATEAARAVIKYGFDQMALNRICAHHMVRNPRSGRVLEKVGMRYEGLMRQPIRKWGKFEDVVLLAILREDWTTTSLDAGALENSATSKIVS